MDERRIAVALIGLGEIGLGAHLPALSREPRVALAALADVDEHRVERAAALAPGARATTAVEAVLADPAIDAVVIATPPWATAQLARGRSRPASMSSPKSPSRPRSRTPRGSRSCRRPTSGSRSGSCTVTTLR